jgi:hypothetical protein
MIRTLASSPGSTAGVWATSRIAASEEGERNDSQIDGKIVRNAPPFPGIPRYGVTIFAVEPDGTASTRISARFPTSVRSTISRVRSVEPPSELTRTAFTSGK